MAHREREEPQPQEESQRLEAVRQQAERPREDPQVQEAVPPQGAVWQEKEQKREALPPLWPQEVDRQPAPRWGWLVPMVCQPVGTR